MRYFLDNSTLFIRGSFRATLPDLSGTILPVSTLLNHTVPPAPPLLSTAKELEFAAAAGGYGRDFSGYVLAGNIHNLCILRYDFLTFFLLAGSLPVNAREPGPAVIGITICSSEGLSDAALREAVTTAQEAEIAALREGGQEPACFSMEKIIMASEGGVVHAGAGEGSPAGTRIRAAIRFGVPLALGRSRGPAQDRPAFFIFSRFKGEHWVEWIPENCPYYPCHFEGQRCDFCYCPLYPCGDETLGQWSESSNGGRVWNCAACRFIHEPAVTEYLKKNPEAPLAELKRVEKNAVCSGPR